MLLIFIITVGYETFPVSLTNQDPFDNWDEMFVINGNILHIMGIFLATFCNVLLSDAYLFSWVYGSILLVEWKIPFQMRSAFPANGTGGPKSMLSFRLYFGLHMCIGIFLKHNEIWLILWEKFSNQLTDVLMNTRACSYQYQSFLFSFFLLHVVNCRNRIAYDDRIWLGAHIRIDSNGWRSKIEHLWRYANLIN